MKTVIIGHFGGYRKMYSFGWTCLIYHATTLFCRRNYNYKNDALGKTVGQMVGAARSARQNIVDAGEAPWSRHDPRFAAVRALTLDPFEATDDLDHAYGAYTLRMRARCAAWLENEEAEIAANAILVTIRRACALLTGQMQRTATDFTTEGGFTERMSAARLAARDAAVQAAGVPACPKCGRPMRKMVARKGRNAGNAFWSCTAYPDCTGTRAC